MDKHTLISIICNGDIPLQLRNEAQSLLNQLLK
jgi:hypothetical protein